MLVRPDQLDWPKHLPAVEFTLNSSVCASTGYAPFELTYGYIPQTIQSVGETVYAGVQDFANCTRDMVIRAHDQGCPRVICKSGKKAIFTLL